MSTRFGPLLVGLLGLACSDPPPATFAECAEVDDPTAREDCRLDKALPLLEDRTTFDARIATLEPVSRDLLLVRLAFQQPHHAAWLCERVTTAEGLKRCERILGRPHLGGSP